MTKQDSLKPPFYITEQEAVELRKAAAALSPSLFFKPATTFDEFAKQLLIPPTISDLYLKAHQIRFDDWEVEAIRYSLARGLLKQVLDEKWKQDKSHPPYIRVACQGKGDFDHLLPVSKTASGALGYEHAGDYGSPVVLELWPAGHYSPIHSHGNTTGILLGLTGQLDIVCYDSLGWDAKQIGMITLTPGQVCWLAPKVFDVHKVACTMPPGSFGASFHVYLNSDELRRLMAPRPDTRDVFDFVDEAEPHEVKSFTTYSDLSWAHLRREISYIAATGKSLLPT